MVHTLKYLKTVHVQYTNIPRLPNFENDQSSKAIKIKRFLYIYYIFICTKTQDWLDGVFGKPIQDTAKHAVILNQKTRNHKNFKSNNLDTVMSCKVLSIRNEPYFVR